MLQCGSHGEPERCAYTTFASTARINFSNLKKGSESPVFGGITTFWGISMPTASRACVKISGLASQHEFWPPEGRTIAHIAQQRAVNLVQRLEAENLALRAQAQLLAMQIEVLRQIRDN